MTNATFLSCFSLYHRLKFAIVSTWKKNLTRKDRDPENPEREMTKSLQNYRKLVRAIVAVASWNSRFNRMRTAVPVIFLPFFNVIYRYNVRVTIKQYANGIEDFSFGGGCLCQRVPCIRAEELALRHFALLRISNAFSHFLPLSRFISFSPVFTLSLAFARLK